MQIIDTHIHPELIKEFQKKHNNIDYNYKTLIENSKKEYIEKMFCISTTIKDFEEYVFLSKTYNEFFF